MNWDYTVRGIASGDDVRIPRGSILVETTHNGEHSRDIEVWAWLSRMRQGHAIERIEVVKHLPNGWVKTIRADEWPKYLLKNGKWLRKGIFEK